MAESDNPPPFTEPVIVPCHFVDGVQIEVHPEFIRLVGWIDLETLANERDPVRRIVLRAAMPLSTARVMAREIRKALMRGGQ